MPEGIHPSLVHRLAQPLPAHLVRAYLASLPAPVPETFRGPNWKQN
ncbi:hypothetical protein [Streptomyces anulatus]|nr:hypothetical protein [Streptomyces anulatus]MCX4504337.1 hypothetical protein [Streptomyces anulatus]